MTYTPEAQRRHRAMLKAAAISAPRRRSKEECPTCAAFRAADRSGRWPVGLCGPGCAGWEVVR